MYKWEDRSSCVASGISTQKEPFPRSEFTLGSIWTCWMLIDRQMQSAFMPELHRWISKLTSRHLQLVHQEIFDHHGKGNGNFVQKKSFEKWKKVAPLLDLKRIKTRNDCEIACDCVKRANVVLQVGLCKEIFARKHTATHKPTSAQPLIVTTMTRTRSLGAVEPRRPPMHMTDVGTGTAFRLDQRKHFRKSKHLLRSEVSWHDQTSIDQYRCSPASIYM